MCRKDHRLVRGRDLVELLHKNGTFGPQAIDDEAVVHDLVADVDRSAELLQGQLDDLDGPIDTGAETARGSEQYG
jgi:hypothetical protein